MPKALSAPGCIRLTEVAGWLRAHARNPEDVPGYPVIIRAVNSGLIPAPLAAYNRREVREIDLPAAAEVLGVELRSDLEVPIAA
jgi:hypothetical protein